MQLHIFRPVKDHLNTLKIYSDINVFVITVAGFTVIFLTFLLMKLQLTVDSLKDK